MSSHCHGVVWESWGSVLVVGWCLLLYLLAACSDITSKPAWILWCSASYHHFKSKLWVVLRSCCVALPVFSSLKGWTPFSWAALCLAPHWGDVSWGKSFLRLCVPASCLPPGFPALSSRWAHSSSMEMHGKGGNLCTRRTAWSVQWGKFLISTSAFLHQSCADTRVGDPGTLWSSLWGSPPRRGRFGSWLHWAALWQLNRTGCNYQN